MQIHRLTLSNIGPFAGEMSIDFGRLSEAGLFLLEGPTGSGKSTILDAIVFALYGTVAGADSGLDRMRSEHADAADPSFVELVFETTAGIYLIRRIPPFERLKKSGTGTTMQKASVSLARLTSPDLDEGEPLSSRHHEADLEVARILGLTRQQFVQTVLLPQGEFAAFLRAAPVERQDLLQRLFGTELFKGMEQELDRRSKTAQVQRQGATRALEDAVTSFLSAADCSAAEREVIGNVDPGELENAVRAIAEDRDAQCIATRAELSSSQQLLTEARARLAAATTHNDRLARKRASATRLAELTEQHDHQSALRADRDRLETVRLLAQVHTEMQRAKERVDRELEAVDLARSQLTADFGSQALADPGSTAKTYTGVADDLAEFAALERALPARRQQCEATETELKELDETIDAREVAAKDLPSELTRLTQLVSQLAVIAANHRTAEAQVSTAQGRLRAAKLVDELAARITAANTEVTELHGDATKANDRLASLEQARLDGIAGELASNLSPGQPCPVCGSQAHPRPATHEPSQPTSAQIDDAKVAAQTARAQLERATARLNRLELENASALAVCDGLSIAQAQEALATAEAEFLQAESAKARLPEAKENLELATNEKDGYQSALAEGNAQRIGLVEKLKEQTESIRETEALIKAELAGFASITDRIAFSRASSKRFSELAEAIARIESAEAELNVRSAEWAKQLAQSTIDDESTFLTLKERVPELAGLTVKVEGYERDLHAARSALSDPELADIDADSEPVDVAPLSEVATTCDTLNQDLSAKMGHWSALAKTTRSHCDVVLAELQTVAQVLQSTASVIRLAGIASATTPANLRRVPLPTYVLITRFKQVLAAANSRLQGMSDGRYSIEYHEERESHGKKSGLGIRILDRLTDKQRSPGDLSGGETFYTALSLALGLADVVVAESGGVDLGTLFIDEGFGSLDPDTLDSVLTEISHLRRGGRVVGIVSHVDELKQRISERIEVRRLDSGRSTITVVA